MSVSLAECRAVIESARLLIDCLHLVHYGCRIIATQWQTRECGVEIAAICMGTRPQWERKRRRSEGRQPADVAILRRVPHSSV